MTQEELEKFLHNRGWYLDLIPRRKGKLYAYAKQRRGTKVITKYLCSEDKIHTLTESSVEQTLNK